MNLNMTVALSPCGVHSSRNCRLEQYATPGDVAMVHKVFPIHATHLPMNFIWVMLFSPQKSHYTKI